MSHFGRLLLAAASSACLLLGAGAGTARAETVECGQVLTRSTTLSGDVTGCPDDGLVIGAHGITLDLNGHTVAGVQGSRTGIDFRGHDRVRVRGGTVRGFPHGVSLDGVRGSALRDMTVEKGGYSEGDPGEAIRLRNSHDNRLVDLEARGGDPAISLTGSDRNRIARAVVSGGIGIHQGDGIRLDAGSDRNRLVDTAVTAEGRGLLIVDSRRSVLRDTTVSGYHGNFFSHAHGTVVRGGGLGSTGPARSGLSAVATDGLVVRGGKHLLLSITGARTRVVDNRIEEGLFVTGPRTVLRGNTVSGSYPSSAVYLGAGSARSRIVGNTATGAYDDGFTIAAPGTLVRGNTATGNGDLGIEAVAGVVDGGGNRASGNGDPRQCVGVRCIP